jgi:glucuronosyltransferase
LILFSSLITTAKSSKILVLVAFPGKSHWLMFEHVIKELLARGHEVTTITNYPLSGRFENYHEYLIHPQFNFESDREYWTVLSQNYKSR